MEQKVTRSRNDPRFQAPDAEVAYDLHRLIEIIRLFRELSPTLPVAYMQAFLTICLKPGGGATDYMSDLDTIQPIVSRILLALGSKTRKGAYGESGLQLLDFSPDPLDMRRNRTFLTPKGRALFIRVIKAIERLKR